MVAVSPLLQRRKTWSCDSDCRERRSEGRWAPGAGGLQGDGCLPYPAVHLLALLALAHAPDVAGEDGEQRGQHSV